jgi:tetratricopeptide (TPR) repeat protein/transcriptional regulator with XRE-family HTH domain
MGTGVIQSPAPDSFGALLRRYRLALGLSQETLSGRSGLSVRAIANLESGRTARPHHRSVQLLADALGLAEPQRQRLARAARDVDSELGTDLPRPPTGAFVPRELPAPVRDFTGRAAELDRLAAMTATAGRAQALIICAVGGTAGVGKTALAVQWAHQAADRFPDGQLYVNLRGYDPGEPAAAADALAGFLRTLGVPGTEIPDGTDERARLYRSRLADRRILVLRDNARDSEQVRPLLPGHPGCAAVITSRDALAGLVVTDGARRLNLDVLPPDDAIALLRSLIGGRVDEDREAAADLAELCARLPLALRIAAELAAARPAAPLAELVVELAASGLGGLDAGEDRASARPVLSWSVRQLPEATASAFALLGLHPGTDLDAYAAAAVTGTAVGQARLLLAQLHRASLLHTHQSGRYAMHDLLRAYAVEQADRYSDGERQQALTRLFDYFRAAAAAAMNELFPAEADLRPLLPPSASAIPVMPSDADARGWLDRERPNLVAVIAHCERYGWPKHATDLAGTLFRYLMTGSHLPEAQAIYGHALQAAHRSGDVAAEATALNGLGAIDMMTGHFGTAAGHLQAALERYRQCGDPVGQGRVLHNLGASVHQLHDYQSAASYYREAIAVFRGAGENLSAARPLVDLADAVADLGSFEEAAEHLEAALPVFREGKDEVGEAGTLRRIAELSLRRGQLAHAGDCFDHALAIYRRIDHRLGIASGLQGLGDVRLRQEDHELAMDYFRQALAVSRQAGYQAGEITTLRSLARVLHGIGQPAAARTDLRAALQLAAETGNTYEQASAHRDLAVSYHSAGDQEQARHHWQHALDLYTQLDGPEMEIVRREASASAESVGELRLSQTSHATD